MEDLSLLLLISFFSASILFFIFIFGSHTSKSAKHPPGPHPFPIIGNILELIGSMPHQALANLSKIYGPIMTLKLGSKTTIVISSPEVAKEVLQKNDQAFSSRSVLDTLRVFDHHTVSMVWLPPSALWGILRKACATKVFSPQQLDATEILRRRKVEELLNFVDECCRKGEALDVAEAALTTVLNSISNTFFSMDLAHYSSDKLKEFKQIIRGSMEEVGKPNFVDFFPIFRFLGPLARVRLNKYVGKLIEIFDCLIEERLRLWDSKIESEVCKDVLDSFLELMMQEGSQLNRLHILHLFLDLFVAGVDTTSSTVEWAMAELLRSPEKLAKARKELQQVLHEGEQLEESHISKLPFLQAVVKETLRLHPPAPLLIPHKAEDEVQLCGFTVPKDAEVLVNVWAMGRDSNIWENPNLFFPERFLERKIDFKGCDFELIPFGAGRRICPGLPMASRTVSFVIASLLRNYDWELADGLKAEDVDMSEKYGITLQKLQPLRAIPIKA